MMSKMKHLQNKEDKWKSVNQELLKTRDSLTLTVHDLKAQLKSHSKLVEENGNLGKQIKELQKKIKEHELDKVRMNAQHSQVIHDLQEVYMYMYILVPCASIGCVCLRMALK